MQDKETMMMTPGKITEMMGMAKIPAVVRREMILLNVSIAARG